MQTSLIIPVYNEEKALDLVVREYLPFVDEIIIVNDGSTDNTLKIADYLKTFNNKIKLINHETNCGKVQAIRTGISHAVGDIIILTDGDYTYPAKHVPELITSLSNTTDLVIGARNTINIPFFNKLGNKIFSSIASYISCINISDAQSGMRAFRKDLFDKIDVPAFSLEYETKLTVRTAKLGYRIHEIPIEYRPRIGKSKLNPIKDGFKMLIALINITLTEIPAVIKLFMGIGFLSLLSGFYTGIMSIYETYLWKFYNLPRIHVYYPILTIFFILFGIFIFSGALLSNYLINKLNRIEEKIIKNFKY